MRLASGATPSYLMHLVDSTTNFNWLEEINTPVTPSLLKSMHFMCVALSSLQNDVFWKFSPHVCNKPKILGENEAIAQLHSEKGVGEHLRYLHRKKPGFLLSSHVIFQMELLNKHFWNFSSYHWVKMIIPRPSIMNCKWQGQLCSFSFQSVSLLN